MNGACRHIASKVVFTLTFLSVFSFASKAQTYKVEEVSYDFQVKEIKGLNSKYDEFSPYFKDDQLIFTSGRESNLVLMGENNWRKTGFYNVFVANIKSSDSTGSKVSTPTLFSKELSNNNHTGPIFFKDKEYVFYTQLTPRIKRQKEIRNPQLYVAHGVDGKWEDGEVLPFCKAEYAYSQPCWNEHDQCLYFTSNISGGKGLNDIYKVKMNEDGSWGELENLSINTEANEMFPFILKHELFFSSDREGGKGKLDIYWKQFGTNEPLQNVEELNTEDDDHGLFIRSDYKLGFYSKRINGQDDIFQLDVERKVRVTNELAGQFTYRNIGTNASGLSLQLLHEQDIIFDVNADEEGKFRFRELPYENYTIKTVAEDNLELVLFDIDGNPVTYLIQDGEGKFQYKKMDADYAGTLSILSEMNHGSQFDFKTISGQFVYEQMEGEYGDSLHVMLVDANGNIVLEQYTDKRGNFTFENVPYDADYTIKTETADDNLFLLIYDQDGDVHTQLKANKDGKYVYKKIDPDYANNLQKLADEEDVFELKTMAITGNFNYKNLEGQFSEGLTVYLFNEEGILLDSTTTNSVGEFMFRGLDPEVSYLFKMNEDDPNFKMEEFNLYVEDRYGNVLADLYRANDGYFRYKTMDIESSGLATIEDQDFKIDIDKTERVPELKSAFDIYFELNSSFTNLKGNGDLKALIEEMKSKPNMNISIAGYADSRSTDQYNMWLSERRGNRVKDFMVARGIAANRIDVKAYGESQLINPCGNDNSCPEEEHAKNRRVQIAIQQ